MQNQASGPKPAQGTFLYKPLVPLKPPLSPFVNKCEVKNGPVTPFKTSKTNDPVALQNKLNILNSIEDKKFFEDLEKIQSRNDGPKKFTAKKIKKNKCPSNASNNGNAAQSFKSNISYILGDLDISGESHEEESEFASSFEISSNSSAPKKVSSPVKQF